MKNLILLLLTSLTLMSCSNNYSNGERVGTITKFSNRGYWWKSWEGEIALSQSGMNTSSTFEFSIDIDKPNENVIKTLDSAATMGWKIEVEYHQVFGLNWFGNRGHTDYFVTGVNVLNKNPMDVFGGGQAKSGHVIDTIYVVIQNDDIIRKQIEDEFNKITKCVPPPDKGKEN